MTATLVRLRRSIRSRLNTCLVAMAMTIIAWSASAQTSPVTKINEEAAKSAVTTHLLRGNVSMLEGSGGNIGVLDAKGGKFMVDAGIAISKEKISAALAKISDAPVKYVVDTHWHWDHSDGNAW